MFAEVVDELVGYSDHELIDRIRANELERRRLDAQMAAALAIADQRGVKDIDGHRSMAAFCRANLNWSTDEASRRMSTARAVDEVPSLGERWYDGRFGAPQAQQFARAHGNRRIRDELNNGAPVLLDHAERLPYSDFQTTLDHFVNLADEDGAHDDRDEQIAGRRADVVDVGGSLDVRASGGDGLTSEEIIQIFHRFTDAEYAKDVAARGAEHGALAGGFPLARSDRQRRFDAMLEIFRCANGSLVPGASTEPTVNVVIDEARWSQMLFEAGLTISSLIDGTEVDPFTGLPVEEAVSLLDRLVADPSSVPLGRCETSTGAPLHPHDVLRAALAGHVRRVVVDAQGVVLDMGRRQRLFTGAARQAAMLLIRHCEHPGCELPADWCEVDHAVEWNNAGPTDQANARINCGFHNRAKHRRRWRVQRSRLGRAITMRDDGSLMLPVGVRESRPRRTTPRPTSTAEVARPPTRVYEIACPLLCHSWVMASPTNTKSPSTRPEPPEQYESNFAMPLSPVELREHQERYLAMPAYRYGLPARLLFWTAGKVFPQGRSFEFFAFVELVARVPYMAWEHVSHIAQTQNHRDHEFDRKIQDRVLLARDEQDNEFWHLLIMEEFLETSGYKRRWFFDKAFPQILSFVYYHLSWFLYVVRPKWSYKLNSDFEDHALREYSKFVAENPEFDETPWTSRYKGDYGFHVTVGDMLRQIAWDEEQHKDHSDDYIRRGARFSRTTG